MTAVNAARGIQLSFSVKVGPRQEILPAFRMTTIWNPDDMAKAAFHEAGHAVVAWSLCLRVEHIELDLANNSGHAEIADADEAVHQVVISYAGFEAEEMFKGPAAFVRAEDDFKRAEEDLKNELAQQYSKDLYSPEGR